MLRSGYGRETCPSVEHWGHSWSSDTHLLAPWPGTQRTLPQCPRSRWPSLIVAALPPYQSSLLKVLSGNPTKPFFTCVIASAPTPAVPPARSGPREPTPSPSPPLPTVKRSKSNTQHSRCSEEVCSPAIAPVIHGPSVLILSRRSGNAAAVGRGAQGCRGRGFLHRPAGCRNGCRSVSLYVPVLSLLQKWCCEALASLVWILDSR